MSYLSVKTCAGCMKAIEERYLLKAVDKFWHTTCLKCCECGVVLEQIGKSCFVKGTAILCRYDYMRMYGSTRQCTRCGEQIAAFDAVYRVNQKVYHVTCFTCTTCKRPLKTGDKYYSIGDGIYCEHDGQATKGDFTS
ncbi:LIM domain transcription factor LMO4.2 [Acropora cervicornis]|uniref:LIM domain transcription factor LMO4.2 n=1 Tax=Acropora cervicornis TaxID=6130 RepID=A0AAD9VAF9_ACRCE|nr:LIM domain transcription factor LMO4.2 [Acropora cervicornis]